MFPGEQFLSHHPPTYEDEWKKTISLIVTLFLCMIFVLPTIAKSIFSSVKTTGESLTLSNESKVKSLEETTKRRKGPKRKKDRRTKESIEQFEAKEKEPIIAEDEIHVPLVFFPVVNLICFLILFMIICLSPNNSYSARRVFIAPLLKESECSDMIDLANRAAEQNAENVRRQLEVSSDSLNGEQIEAAKKILLKPAGWSKDRHTNYPTTDLNVVVTFAKEDKLKLKKMLDGRLSPLLEKLYGVPAESIRAQDMFLVRYDGDGQQKLAAHTDSSHISFNVLLNKDFSGGGTRFYNSLEQTFEDVHLNPGEVVINNAMVTHEGLPTTSGTRYIFVGFMHVDRMNPWNGVRNSLNLFSSWLSFPWLTVIIKEGLMVAGIKDENTEAVTTNRSIKTKFSKNKYVDKILQQAMIYFSVLGDLFAAHGIVKLVDPRNHNDYLLTMDDEHEKRGKYSNQAEWFSGQQIYVAFDGRYHSEWSSRTREKEKFHSHEL